MFRSSIDVFNLIMQAELQTERQRITLYDSTKVPMDYIRAGGRHDFIIEHDIKELGPHTYVPLLMEERV